MWVCVVEEKRVRPRSSVRAHHRCPHIGNISSGTIPDSEVRKKENLRSEKGDSPNYTSSSARDLEISIQHIQHPAVYTTLFVSPSIFFNVVSVRLYDQCNLSSVPAYLGKQLNTHIAYTSQTDSVIMRKVQASTHNNIVQIS